MSGGFSYPMPKWFGRVVEYGDGVYSVCGRVLDQHEVDGAKEVLKSWRYKPIIRVKAKSVQGP